MRVATQGIDYTSRDYLAFKNDMINHLQKRLPEYTDTSDTDAGIVILEELANGCDILYMYLDITANDMFLSTTQDRTIATVISKCLGYTPYNQTTSSYPQVFVLESALEEDLVIPKGTVVKTLESNDLVEMKFETQEDLVIPKDKIGNEKDEEGNYLYTVLVKQGETISNDYLGSSDGSASQSFMLSYTEVLIDSLVVEIDEGSGFEEWERVDSFIYEEPDSKVYTVTVNEFDECIINFGNGLKGKVPEEYADGIRATYMVGGGDASVVPENIITQLDSDIDGVESTFNLEAVEKGHDKEDIDSIKENAPAMYRARERLVTLEDYEDLLRIHFYDFLRLKAKRDTENARLVHIYYMMREGYTLNDSLISAISEYIEKRSMIGTSYDLTEYTKESLDLELSVYYDKDYDKDAVEKSIKDYLTDVIFKYGNLTFELSLVKSDLEMELRDSVDGAISVRISSPTGDIISPSEEQNVLTLGTVTFNSEAI